MNSNPIKKKNVPQLVSDYAHDYRDIRSNEEELTEMLTTFAREILSLVEECVPEEREDPYIAHQIHATTPKIYPVICDEWRDCRTQILSSLEELKRPLAEES